MARQSCRDGTCQAGPLFDWLFRRQPQTVATTAGYAPAPGSSCGQGYCEQTVLQYVPQVAYRTVWEAVPVTTYRRTVSYNPANGLPMTCTQPCTSYTSPAASSIHDFSAGLCHGSSDGTCDLCWPPLGPAVAVPAPGCNCGTAAPTECKQLHLKRSPTTQRLPPIQPQRHLGAARFRKSNRPVCPLRLLRRHRVAPLMK